MRRVASTLLCITAFMFMAPVAMIALLFEDDDAKRGYGMDNW